MASVNYDSNTQEATDTTNVLAPASSGQPASTTPAQTSTSAPVSTTSSPTYVSNGNPYGSYAQPSGSQPAPSAGTQSARKSDTGASSGQFTNVQSYIDKNKQSSQNLGTAVAGKLQNTTDIAKQNLQSVENKFGQGMEAGSLENRGQAVSDVKTAATEAAGQSAANKTWNERGASMYAPTKTAEGAYSAEDQALVDKNLARVLYGDGSTKDFATQAEAANAMESYNKANPGYFTYGNEQDLSVSEDRLKNILNAEYKGPNELSEISGYGNAYNKFQDVAALQNQALKGGSNTELLNRTFAEQGDYTAGSKLLDDLLLGQGAANQTLRTTAEKLGSTPTGKIGDEFSARAKEARGQAVTRTGEINQVKEEARQALTDTSLNRNKEVNDRITGVIENWDKYPQYFRERFQDQLTKHNEASTKNKEYQAVASKYQGGEAGAKARIAAIQQTTPNIQNFDIDAAFQKASQLANYDDAVERATTLNDPMERLRWQRVADTYAKNNNIEQLRSELVNDQVTAQGLGLEGNLLDLYKTANQGSTGIGGARNQAAKQIQILRDQTNRVKNEYNAINADLPVMGALTQYKDYDPNSLNLELSQLESEALGIQGGEGLYNLLKDRGVEGLLKTAAYDKNKLVSEDEQSQLARLQSIAQLASDYGVKGSGLDFRNQFSERDLAGQQNATSALDTENFKNLMQGAERDFRTNAAASNIVGSGYGTGSSGGAFGTKRAQSWKSVSQNFEDLINKAGGYRNIYSDEGVDKDLLKQIASQAQGNTSFQLGNVDPGVVGGTMDAIGAPADYLSSMLGNSGTAKTATNLAMLTNPVTAPIALANMLGSFVGGSSAEAQGRADYAAGLNAVENLKGNIQSKINTTGLKNQLSVGQNTNQDLELFKLLGLLDTTNL